MNTLTVPGAHAHRFRHTLGNCAAGKGTTDDVEIVLGSTPDIIRAALCAMDNGTSRAYLELDAGRWVWQALGKLKKVGCNG
jgi:hypothetical protein